VSRRFTDARALLHDLLDRHEEGTAGPIAHPDYSGFADISEIDRFVNELAALEATGAVRLARGRGRNEDQIAHVRLQTAAPLYEWRPPAGRRTCRRCRPLPA
jgi:hypothetical protein